MNFKRVHNTAPTRTAILALLRYHRVLTRSQLILLTGHHDRWIRLALRDLGGVVVHEGRGMSARYALAADPGALTSGSGTAANPDLHPDSNPDASGSGSGCRAGLPEEAT